MDEHGTRGAERNLVPTSPTGRVPQWVLDESLGLDVQPMALDVQPMPWTSSRWRAAPPPPSRRRGRNAVRALVVLALVLFLVVGAAVLAGPGPWPWGSATPGRLESGEPEASAAPVPTDRPVAGNEAADSPLGTPPPPPPEGGAHTFVTFQEDGVTPVAYDPCRPVHYVLRPDAAPPGGEQLVHEAFARLSEVTGLQFVHDGATDEPATRDRELFQPARYGNRWAPVLVAWETEEQNPALAGEIVGEAGSVAVSLGDGPRVYLTGTVSLDAGTLPELLTRRDGPPWCARSCCTNWVTSRASGTSRTPASCSIPKAQEELTDYAIGDLTGLSRLGSGPCVADL